MMPKNGLLLVAAIYLGSFVALLDVSIVNVALPLGQRSKTTGVGVNKNPAEAGFLWC